MNSHCVWSTTQTLLWYTIMMLVNCLLPVSSALSTKCVPDFIIPDNVQPLGVSFPKWYRLNFLFRLDFLLEVSSESSPHGLFLLSRCYFIDIFIGLLSFLYVAIYNLLFVLSINFFKIKSYIFFLNCHHFSNLPVTCSCSLLHFISLRYLKPFIRVLMFYFLYIQFLE